MAMSVVVLMGNVLSALGAGCLAWALSDFLSAPVEQVWLRLIRRRYALADLSRRAIDSQQPLSASVLYGLGAANTSGLALAAGAIGVMFTQFVFSPALALPLRLSGALAGLVPIAMRNAREQRARRALLVEIRRLLADLAVALRYEASPGKALAMAAARDEAGIAHRRLRAFLAGQQGEPEKALARLADDLRSPELQRLVRRMGAARRGGLAFERALSLALDEVVEESEAVADAEIESAPDKLSLAMIVALLTPALILLVFPVGFYVLAQLARI